MQVMKQSCCRFDVRDNVFAKSRSNVIRYVTTSFGRSLKHPIKVKGFWNNGHNVYSKSSHSTILRT